MVCLTWNLELTPPNRNAGRLILDQIAAIDPDVVCYTEVVRAMVPEGHCIEADPDYGYPNDGGRRKVALWSKQPWTEVDATGDNGMPPGRFVSGVTGGVRFVGVCIPWRDAHVRTGRRDRKPWEDHLSYCEGLGRVLGDWARHAAPTCVLGDFNQRIPRVSQPAVVATTLADAFPIDFKIATKGMKDSEGHNLIDHVAVSPGLSISIKQIVPKFASDGTRLSDHVGVVALLDLNHANRVR